MNKTIRYLFAGGLGAGLNFLIYFVLLRGLGVWYLLASIIAFVLSLLAGFYLQKHFTFKDFSTDNTKRKMVYYYIFSLVNLLINVLLMIFLVEVLLVDKILAKILTLAILAMWSFFVYQHYIFNQSNPFSASHSN